MRVSWEAVRKKFNLKKNFKDYFLLIGRPFEKILSTLKIKKDYSKIKKLYSDVSIKNTNKIKFYKNTKKELNNLKNLNFTLCMLHPKI